MINESIEFCGLCHYFDYDTRICERSGLSVKDFDRACGDYYYWADAYASTDTSISNG